jgi:hypothetical protein
VQKVRRGRGEYFTSSLRYDLHSTPIASIIEPCESACSPLDLGADENHIRPWKFPISRAGRTIRPECLHRQDRIIRGADYPRLINPDHPLTLQRLQGCVQAIKWGAFFLLRSDLLAQRILSLLHRYFELKSRDLPP